MFSCLKHDPHPVCLRVTLDRTLSQAKTPDPFRCQVKKQQPPYCKTCWYTAGCQCKNDPHISFGSLLLSHRILLSNTGKITLLATTVFCGKILWISNGISLNCMAYCGRLLLILQQIVNGKKINSVVHNIH